MDRKGVARGSLKLCWELERDHDAELACEARGHAAVHAVRERQVHCPAHFDLLYSVGITTPYTRVLSRLIISCQHAVREREIHCPAHFHLLYGVGMSGDTFWYPLGLVICYKESLVQTAARSTGASDSLPGTL